MAGLPKRIQQFIRIFRRTKRHKILRRTHGVCEFKLKRAESFCGLFFSASTRREFYFGQYVYCVQSGVCTEKKLEFTYLSIVCRRRCRRTDGGEKRRRIYSTALAVAWERSHLRHSDNCALPSVYRFHRNLIACRPSSAIATHMVSNAKSTVRSIAFFGRNRAPPIPNDVVKRKYNILNCRK